MITIPNVRIETVKDYRTKFDLETNEGGLPGIEKVNKGPPRRQLHLLQSLPPLLLLKILMVVQLLLPHPLPLQVSLGEPLARLQKSWLLQKGIVAP